MVGKVNREIRHDRAALTLLLSHLTLLREVEEALEVFARLAEKFPHEIVVEICSPHPDNPSRHIVPFYPAAFRRAARVLAKIKGERL